MTQARRVRVLLAVTFYNGRAFARRTMESIERLKHDDFDLDILVLDDSSPEPGFSELLAKAAADVGAVYYRSPRNLGIPRNVNLGLATAQQLEYDYVVISNSDVIYADNSVRVMLDVASTADRVASVTAWSTNVPPYSIPNAAELYTESQVVTDAIGETLLAHFGRASLEIPAGISFAMMIPVAVLDSVGLMDPIFGRGYGEESDWSARASSAGYRHLLALGAFVYHAGRGSTLAAGIVAGDAVANWANQRIVNSRTPIFASNVDGFLRSGELEQAQVSAVRSLVVAAAAQHGYAVLDRTRDWEDQEQHVVMVAIRSASDELCTALWCGFTTEIDTDSNNVLGTISDFFDGASPVYSNIEPPTWEAAARFGYPLGI